MTNLLSKFDEEFPGPIMFKEEIKAFISKLASSERQAGYTEGFKAGEETQRMSNEIANSKLQ